MSAAARTAVRVTGWLLVAAGALVGLYLVYALVFTGVETEKAQRALGDQWRAQVGSLQPTAAPGRGGGRRDREPEIVRPGQAVAVLQFRRPGSDRPPVYAEPLFVVEGVGSAELARGPGHYPDTAQPGRRGNFAVAGHRTTYGAPFFHLDQLRAGDEIWVTDRRGVRHTYRVRRQQVVAPSANWVLRRDPLDRGRPLLTLTTCNPRFSAAERLVVFAELLDA